MSDPRHGTKQCLSELGDAVGAWLLCNGQVIASLDIARSRAAKRRGLLGRDSIDSAILLVRTRSVHTVGMREPILVAACDRDLRVVELRVLPPGRILLPRLRTRHVVEMPAGHRERFGVAVGDRLEVRR